MAYLSDAVVAYLAAVAAKIVVGVLLDAGNDAVVELAGIAAVADQAVAFVGATSLGVRTGGVASLAAAAAVGQMVVSPAVVEQAGASVADAGPPGASPCHVAGMAAALCLGLA